MDNHSVFFTILLVVLLNSCNFNALALRSPTGQIFSKSHVRQSLPVHIRSHISDLSSHIYELCEEQGTILGPNNFTLHLSDLSNFRTVRWHPSLKVEINGESVQERPENIRVLSRNGYNVLLHGKHSRPLHIWGRGLHLHPVSSKYPGILFNYKSSEHDLIATNSNSKYEVDINIEKEDEEIGLDVNFTDTLSRQSSVPCTAANRHVIEISAAFETTFCALAQNEKMAALGLLQSVFDDANYIFRRDTCVEVALVHVDGYCACSGFPDPYSSIFVGLPSGFGTYSGMIFERFRTIYKENRSNVRRDIAYMFSAYLYSGSFSWGIAAQPGTCSNDFAYGIVNGPNFKVLTHEVGHNLNCPHTNSGIMLASIQNNQLFFAQDSLTTLTNYINNAKERSGSQSSCLSTDLPSCDSTCPAPCTNGRCVAPVNPRSGFTSCKLSADAVRCAKLIDIGLGNQFIFYQSAPCPSKYVEVPFNASDPTVLCCPTADSRTELAGSPPDVVLFTYTIRGVPYLNSLGSRTGRPLNSLATQRRFLQSLSMTCSYGGNTPTPSPSSTTSPNPTPSVSQNNSRLPAGTCGDLFSSNYGLKCNRAAKRVIRVSGGYGKVTIKLQLQFGSIKAYISAKKGRYIQSVNFRLTGGPQDTHNYSGKSKVVAELYSKQIRNLPLPGSFKTCCGRGKLNAIVSFTICQGSLGCSKSGNVNIPLSIKCKRLCKNNSDITPLSMSESTKCSSCKRS